MAPFSTQDSVCTATGQATSVSRSVHASPTIITPVSCGDPAATDGSDLSLSAGMFDLTTPVSNFQPAHGTTRMLLPRPTALAPTVSAETMAFFSDPQSVLTEPLMENGSFEALDTCIAPSPTSLEQATETSNPVPTSDDMASGDFAPGQYDMSNLQSEPSMFLTTPIDAPALTDMLDPVKDSPMPCIFPTADSSVDQAEADTALFPDGWFAGIENDDLPSIGVEPSLFLGTQAPAVTMNEPLAYISNTTTNGQEHSILAGRKPSISIRREVKLAPSSQLPQPQPPSVPIPLVANALDDGAHATEHYRQLAVIVLEQKQPITFMNDMIRYQNDEYKKAEEDRLGPPPVSNDRQALKVFRKKKNSNSSKVCNLKKVFGIKLMTAIVGELASQILSYVDAIRDATASCSHQEMMARMLAISPDNAACDEMDAWLKTEVGTGNSTNVWTRSDCVEALERMSIRELIASATRECCDVHERIRRLVEAKASKDHKQKIEEKEANAKLAAASPNGGVSKRRKDPKEGRKVLNTASAHKINRSKKYKYEEYERTVTLFCAYKKHLANAVAATKAMGSVFERGLADGEGRSHAAPAV